MSSDVRSVLEILAECEVRGHPKTKGSLEHIGNGQLRESVRGSNAWRKMVAERVGADRRRRLWPNPLPLPDPMLGEVSDPFNGRVGVRVVSYLQPPAAVLRRDVEVWRDWLMSDKSGDVDKLLRNVLDAIGCEDKDDAQLIANDGQVWDAMSHKRLAVGGVAPGQLIQIWKIPEDAPW